MYIYILNLRFRCLKKEKIYHFFFFSENVNDSIYQFLKSTVSIRSFKGSYKDTAQSSLSYCATYIRF